MKLSIVTVCHNSARTLPEYVASFLRHDASQAGWIEFVFVENSGNDIARYLEPLRQAGFTVNVIETANNGFGTACNVGARKARGDLLAFVNPDIVFCSTLAPLRETSATWGTVRQITGGGEVLSVDRLPEHRSVWYYFARGARKVNRLLRDRERLYASGSFMLVAAFAFRELGGFDERFFLYYEEAELARRLIARYGPLEIIEDVTVLHEGLASHPSSDAAFRHEAQGLVTYCRVTGQPRLLTQRFIILGLMGLVSSQARRRIGYLRKALAAS